MKVNIAIAQPKSFRFDNGEPDIEGTVARPMDMRRGISGYIETGIVVDLERRIDISSSQGNQLFLLPDAPDGTRKLMKGHSVWADAMLITDATKVVNHNLEDKTMLLIGRATVMIIQP